MSKTDLMLHYVVFVSFIYLYLYFSILNISGQAANICDILRELVPKFDKVISLKVFENYCQVCKDTGAAMELSFERVVSEKCSLILWSSNIRIINKVNVKINSIAIETKCLI